MHYKFTMTIAFADMQSIEDESFSRTITNIAIPIYFPCSFTMPKLKVTCTYEQKIYRFFHGKQIELFSTSMIDQLIAANKLY